MKKTYTDFLEIVKRKIDLYTHIPERHLSIEGRGICELYKAVDYLACFTSNAAELLEMLSDDKDVEEAAKYSGGELQKITRHLKNIADDEKLQAS